MTDSRTVLEAKRFEIYTCQLNTSLRDACRKMVEKDISCLIVTDDNGCLAGILTRTDLLRARLEDKDWYDNSTSDYMNRDVVTVTPKATLQDVAQLLAQHHIHRVVITRSENGDHFPLGVISDSDLIYHMAYQFDL